MWRKGNQEKTNNSTLTKEVDKQTPFDEIESKNTGLSPFNSM